MWRKTSPRNYLRKGTARLKKPTHKQMYTMLNPFGFKKIKVSCGGEAKYCI